MGYLWFNNAPPLGLRHEMSVGVEKMNASPRKTRFAYATMVAFMALSTAALATASASGGYKHGVSVVEKTISDHRVSRDAG